MERRAISIHGLVQGVGFRPYVQGLASRLALSGFVANQTDGVRIEVEGERARLDLFLEELPRSAPPAAQIERLSWTAGVPTGERAFEIRESRLEGASSPLFTADRATCDDCARELFDPADRRYRYAFSSCTQCGPRLTIVTGAPYDRERTTMARFAMCERCRKEYEDPSDRRFHAQPTACAACGPSLRAIWPSDDATPEKLLQRVADTVLAGGIVALKGLGGFHLICDATSDGAVKRLRERKRRCEKPFAVMVADVEGARAVARVDADEARLLESARRPIVLLRKHEPESLARGVAPGNPHVGLMLPYTPVHLLLMRDLGSRPLVATSGNRSDEPIVHRDEDAFERLGAVADVIVGNDRPVRVRCDDSVTRVLLGEELPIRRSRGYAPEPIALTRPSPRRLLAVGAHLKNTFALGIGGRAIVSHHVGDLDEVRAYEAFERDIGLYQELFGFEPEALVHDLHPDYLSTRYALERSAREGIPALAVQHHHAHVASAVSERGLAGPVIGVAFDGTGYGPDGTIWGGEFLVGGCERVERAAHLRAVPLPGGDAATREPWRMALSHLVDAGVDPTSLTERLDVHGAPWQGVLGMIERRVRSPLTSSAGRLFDAVAALVGLRERASYEGQAAMELEWLCGGSIANRSYPVEVDGGVIDTRTIILGVAEDVRSGVERSEIARRFHATMVALVGETSERLREECDVNRVVLTGGCFQNALLTEGAVRGLEQRGFEVHRHRKVPPNDGGISLGQLAVAAAKLAHDPMAFSRSGGRGER